jgi:hypothetical protein
MITNAGPSNETSRWRDDDLENYQFQKQKGRFLVQEKKINYDNTLMEERLKNIADENRKEKTHEYAPGFRVGSGKLAYMTFDHLIISLIASPHTSSFKRELASTAIQVEITSS